MNRNPILLILVLLLSAGAPAQEEHGKPAAAPSVDELIAAYTKDMNGIRAALDGEKDPEKASALIERFRRTPQEYMPRIRKAADAAKGTPAEARGVVWMFRRTREKTSKEKLLQRLLEHLQCIFDVAFVNLPLGQRLGQRFQRVRQRCRAKELDHLQGAVHLMHMG